MILDCTICGISIRIKNEKEVQKPFICKSCRPNHGKNWTKEEVDKVKLLRSTTTLSVEEIADRLEMGYCKVQRKIAYLGLYPPKRNKSIGRKRTIGDIEEIKVTTIEKDKKKIRKDINIWIPVKDLTWMLYKGEITDGYKVIIKDIKKPQNSLENLELVII